MTSKRERPRHCREARRFRRKPRFRREHRAGLNALHPLRVALTLCSVIPSREHRSCGQPLAKPPALLLLWMG